MTKETQELTRDVFKSDMQTAMQMRELVENHDPNEISQSSVDVIEEMVVKIEDPMKEKCLYATCFQIAQSLENRELAQFASDQLEKWGQKHG